ncbi:phage major capsid protein [Vagococcus vulneris]|uniref:Phage major capsid protein n=1 Tax=Vagococcus vulneris TaxID=1977869 RepID=A0A429ZTG5_9ENTE|nr:phage major capsid protein [Vagococcus vulneris]RST96976.1 phage major capsid protein [Vagococcus vulneris]
MTLKGFEKTNELQKKFFELGAEASAEEKQNTFAEMMNAHSEELEAKFKEEMKNAALTQEMAKGMNREEYAFFNDIKKDVGYKEEKLLPQTTVDEIFEDLTTEHPILSYIGLKNNGLRLKFLKSETTGVAVWGKIFGEIKGQLDAAFSEEEDISDKLTAFVVLPKDLDQFGPEWIKRFVKEQIVEANAVALEEGFIIGDGNEKPVGLNRQVQKGVSITGGVYPEKASSGKLTFKDSRSTVKELTEVFKYHSIKENGKPVNVAGKVVMIVNPVDAWDVRTQYTFLNANGTYVTALPFNLTLIESLAVPVKKAITFVSGRYHAYIAGGLAIRMYDQTFAMEDLDLYVAKNFVYGKAKDDKTAAVWDLEIDNTVTGDDGKVAPKKADK